MFIWQPGYRIPRPLGFRPVALRPTLSSGLPFSGSQSCILALRRNSWLTLQETMRLACAFHSCSSYFD